MFRLTVTTPKSSGRFKRIRASLARLSGGSVTVGVRRNAEPYDNGADPHLVAFWLEYGTARMPARPFLGPALRENVNLLRQATATAGGAVMFNQRTPDMALASVGAVALGLVQAKMLSNTGAPLSGSYHPPAGYLGYKARHDMTSDTLIATGHLFQSMAYRVNLPNGETFESDEGPLPPGAAGQTQRAALGREQGRADMRAERDRRAQQRRDFKAAQTTGPTRGNAGASHKASTKKHGATRKPRGRKP